MKITGATTLAELAIRRMQLGIETITIIPGANGISRTAFVRGASPGHFIGNGATEAEALDQAFANLENSIGTKIHRQQRAGVAIKIEKGAKP